MLLINHSYFFDMLRGFNDWQISFFYYNAIY